MPLKDTLLRASAAYLYRMHFSQEILDGATRNLVKNSKMTPENAKRFQATLLRVFPDALVEVPRNLEGAMTNDPGDRHVLAAAVVSQAETIVTSNLKHFKPEDLAPWNITAQHPDEFLTDLCELHGTEALAKVLQEQVKDLKRPPMTVLDLLERLHPQVPIFTSRMVIHFCGKEVEATAKVYIKYMAPTLGHNHYLYSGKYYYLQLFNGKLTIIAKDGRGEILSSKGGMVTGTLTPEDVRRFQTVKATLETPTPC